MRKLLLAICLLASGVSFGQMNLPNGGFEAWEVDSTFESLDEWNSIGSNEPGAVVKSTDFQDGSLSLQLTTDANNEPAGVALFDPAAFSGIPYSTQVDSFVCFVKYDMVPTDSAQIIVVQFANGNFVPTILPIGGVQPNWTRIALKLTLPQQDSIAVIVASGPVFGGAGIAGSTISFDNAFMVKVLGNPPALPNFSLEDYSSTDVMNPVDFNSTNILLRQNGFTPNVTESVIANNGTSSVKLETVNAGLGGAVAGIVTNGSIDGNGNLSNGQPFTSQPTILKGFYLYEPVASDAAYVSASFYNNGAIIEDVTFIITTGTSTFTEFTVTLDVATVPDSMMIFAYSGDEIGSVLYLDDVAFDYENIGLNETQLNLVSIYPNPATNLITITSESIIETVEIYSVTGQLVKSVEMNSVTSKINVEGLKSGSYVIELLSGENKQTERLIIK
ncbi:MAG: hypothetical protein ACI9XP_001529 [Lentimonas sp.]|jgi:hypothetical protein